MLQQRTLKLNEATSGNGRCVVYVMSRDQRVADNHALLAAQQDAIKNEQPLVVVFNVLEKSGVRSREHFEFMLEGLKEIEKELINLNIRYITTSGDAFKNISDALKKLEASTVYFDFNPLRGPRALQKKLASNLGVPVFVVDAHNIIPVWVTSDKEEFAAHTIRSKIHKNLADWLVEPEQIMKHPYDFDFKEKNNWVGIESKIKTLPTNRAKIGFEPGESAANKSLQDFIANRLNNYAELRNTPTENGQSNLSPYLHYGQISALRVALEVSEQISEPFLLLREAKLASYEGEPELSDSVNAFLEELIVRKELADNYCFYNTNYDNIGGAREWAETSLAQHAKDSREFIYGREEWEAAKTHDTAWNAAQNEMMKSGKMHGYMRMYWAKKILEWSASPAEAVQTAVYLNDKYSFDGGDPNGYTGIMWSIAGIHDRPWFEREVYGKIRYMNRSGLKKRFNVEEYEKKWLT